MTCDSLLRAVIPGFLLVVGTGCGTSTASVDGLVRFADKEVETGQIHFFGADQTVKSGLITPEGKYAVQGLSPGKVVVCIEAYAFQGASKPGGEFEAVGTERAPTKKSLVPLRYADPKTSGLSFDLVAGAQKIDVILVK